MSSIYHSTRKIKVSNLGRENTLPIFSLTIPKYKVSFDKDIPKEAAVGAVTEGAFKMMPYLVQDHYDRAQKDSTLNTIILENSKLKATFYPQYGGRLASLYDKEKKKELLFDNPVFQPANLALRNAWFSGGIEWNGPVYGHTLLTCTPIYFAKVKVDNQEILRIYEYDRLLNTTWQVDFYLPENSTNLWYHVTARNLNNYEIPFYWWTNIATPLSEKIRFITSTKDTLNHFFDQLIFNKWPIEKEIDISYPKNYKTALSLFYLDKECKIPWFSYADETGYGLFHIATPKLKGKKLWYFGYGQGGTNWMDTLSLPGKGQYIEIQAGITETQLQVTPLAANSSISWTACFGPLNCNAEKVHDKNYDIAVKHTQQKLEEIGLYKDLDVIDNQMTKWEDITPDSIIYEGQPWGSLQEKLSGKKIPGLLFTAPITEIEKPWLELLTENKFSKDSLNKNPHSWNTSKDWHQKIQSSIDAGFNTWLHQLHLGVIYMEQQNLIKAKQHFEASIELKPNFQSMRAIAIIEINNKNFEKGIETYLKAWQNSNQNIDLFIELSKLLVDKNEVKILENLVNECPKEIEDSEFVSLSKATIALSKNQFDLARKHLIREYLFIREGNTITTKIWFDTFYQAEELKKGRPLSDNEKEIIRTNNPPPSIIDFQMKE